MFFQKIAIVEDSFLQRNWVDLKNYKSLTVKRCAIGEDPKYFCMGSCFAEEIRYSLKRNADIDCFPKFDQINFDKKLSKIDTLGIGRFHMNHYSTASILQELKRSL